VCRSQCPRLLRSPPRLPIWRVSRPIGSHLRRRHVQIFRDKAFYTLNTATKRYTKTDQASLNASLKKLDEATDKLYAQLPPAERERIKKSRQSKPALEQAVMKPTPRTESAAGLSCKVWEVFVNGNKVREQCVAEMGALPNAKDLQTTLREVNEAFKNSPGALQAWADVQQMNGYPIITRVYVNGKLAQEVKTTAIRAEKTSDSQFTIPAGFKEQDMSDMIGEPSR
jgi:hypothetical protein